ncbi:hypothetical protein LTR85_005650 [Meristemomyces frigidus]|nr:hypothetical protein LTR85_005650 [Meristemomyces frigidus]
MTTATTKSSNVTDDIPCRLLNRPAELRNRIYELAFTTDIDTGVGIALGTAAGPSKALVITCRQIYSEARTLHEQASRQYWKHSTFVLDQRPRICARSKIQALGVENVNAITSLILLARGPGGSLALHRPMGDGRWSRMDYHSMLHLKPWFEEMMGFAYRQIGGMQVIQEYFGPDDTLKEDGQPPVPLFEQLCYWFLSE